MSHHKSWTLLSLGLLLVVFGSLALIFLLSYWEQSMRDKKLGYSLLLAQHSQPSTSKKEDKVTLLDPSLSFDSIMPHGMSSKENSKEMNFIDNSKIESHHHP